MKKSILSAFAVVAVVFSALAFTAPSSQFYVYQKKADGTCPKLGRFNAGSTQIQNARSSASDLGPSVPVATCINTINVTAE